MRFQLWLWNNNGNKST